jgi:hypothetical protein
MGLWGDQPWENDGAADWVFALFETTALRRQVVDGLNKTYDHPDGPTLAHEPIRAAAHVLVSLAEVWPQSYRHDDLSLAAAKLQALLDEEVFEAHDYQGETLDLIRRELSEIRLLLGTYPSGAFRPDPEGSCCAFAVQHTEHVDLAEPVVRRSARLGEILGTDLETLGTLIDCGEWMVAEGGETELGPGDLIDDHAYHQLRDVPGLRAEYGAKAIREAVSEDLHAEVLLTRIPDLRSDSKAQIVQATTEVVQASERLAKLLELGAPAVILRNERASLQRAVDGFVRRLSFG